MKKLLGIALLLILIPASIAADQCSPYLNGGGYARYLPVTAMSLTGTPAAGVTLPQNATGAIIFVNGANIRYRNDGVAPTATEGALVMSGKALVYTFDTASQLRTLTFIQTSSAAEVTVVYCRLPAGTTN